MSVLYVVIPLALGMSAVAVAVFWWAVRHGQFDDLTTPSLRMLHDDELHSRQAQSEIDIARTASPTLANVSFDGQIGRKQGVQVNQGLDQNHDGAAAGP